jgi:hypothetical protein
MSANAANVSGMDQRDDPRRCQQHPKQRPQPSGAPVQRGQCELLGREQQKHDPGEYADGDH